MRGWLARRRAERRGRVLAALDRYPPDWEMFGGDLARMAYVSLVDVQIMEAVGLLMSRPDPAGTGRRLYCKVPDGGRWEMDDGRPIWKATQ